MYPYVYHNYAQVQYIQISRVALYTHCLYSRCIGVLYQLYFSCVSLQNSYVHDQVHLQQRFTVYLYNISKCIVFMTLNGLAARNILYKK